MILLLNNMRISSAMFKVLGQGMSHGRASRASYSTPAITYIEGKPMIMPSTHFEPEPYQGMSMKEALEIRKSNLTPALLTYYKQPLMIHQGRMQWLWDHEGKRYLDLIGGINTVSVGHCHPLLVSALESQMRTLWHTSSIWMNPKIHEYAKKLTDKMPGNLKVVYLVNSGSEANDMAIMMARLYTGHYDIIGLRNAYHGGSPQTMPLNAMSIWRHKIPMSFGVHQTMNPDPYRGPWGGAHCRDSPCQSDRCCSCDAGECQAADLYANQLDDVLMSSIPNAGVAAFIAEAIQGGGGVVQYPKDYLKKAFDLVRSRGGLCISDEVQTGFGRTGDHYWGFQGHGVMPDIVTMAKGIGNGFPLAAVITTPEIASSLGGALHFNTFGGNPMACAVGSALLDAVDQDKCMENSKIVGTYILNKLQALKEDFDIIGDIRGKGLMIGIEFVKDRETKEPLDKDLVANIMEVMKDHGVLVGKSGKNVNCFRLKPPMCITKSDADFTIDVIKHSLKMNGF